ncbi:MAG TPA: phage Gp37/Gp68 family protein, partial [Anaerovoracaceae bacterium]|nr:phage Gp37/Gp68 family protein [Anaerovoracaceae bacterium]
KISAGCTHCYAERMAKRLKAMRNPRYFNGFDLTIHRDLFEVPLKIRQPRMIFVNSMSDLFHEDIPDDIIIELISIMSRASWHTFQILTKRSGRLREMDAAGLIQWPVNVWMGVTVEDIDTTYRIDDLRGTGAAIKFLSCEPLLSDLGNLDLTGIDWAIVGGESGPGARPIEKEWIENIKNNCEDNNVSFFFKQWGGKNKKKNGRLLNGQTYDHMPR